MPAIIRAMRQQLEQAAAAAMVVGIGRYATSGPAAEVKFGKIAGAEVVGGQLVQPPAYHARTGVHGVKAFRTPAKAGASSG